VSSELTARGIEHIVACCGLFLFAN